MNWRCPNCKSLLQVKETHALTCENGHSFDRAKQGYYNLLLANKKSSKDPGDNACMGNARHQFLIKGYYAPLAEKLSDFVRKALPSEGEATVLDCGCGEGYYSRLINELIDNTQASLYGIDISKHAIKKAASITPQHLAVASSYDIPLPDHSIDVAFSVFAPFSEQEMKRILKPDGTLVRVLPGPKHLIELKRIIYDQAETHKPPKSIEGFIITQEQSMSFDMTFHDKQDAGLLLAMTPFAWRQNKTDEHFQSQALKKISADFIVQIFH